MILKFTKQPKQRSLPPLLCFVFLLDVNPNTHARVREVLFMRSDIFFCLNWPIGESGRQKTKENSAKWKIA